MDNGPKRDRQPFLRWKAQKRYGQVIISLIAVPMAGCSTACMRKTIKQMHHRVLFLEWALGGEMLAPIWIGFIRSSFIHRI